MDDGLDMLESTKQQSVIKYQIIKPKAAVFTEKDDDNVSGTQTLAFFFLLKQT